MAQRGANKSTKKLDISTTQSRSLLIEYRGLGGVEPRKRNTNELREASVFLEIKFAELGELAGIQKWRHVFLARSILGRLEVEAFEVAGAWVKLQEV